MKKKLDLLTLWAMGLGIPLSVFENERFIWETEHGFDPLGCLQAIQREIDKHADEAWTEARTAINNPRYKLEFIHLCS